MATQSECSNECTICLLNYTEETKKTTECNHTFHDECIGRWLQTNNSCPLCRAVLNQQTRIVDGITDTFGEPTFGQSTSPSNVEDPIIYRGSSIIQLIAYGARDRMLNFNNSIL